MLISWNWLKQYVALDVSAAELQRRLMFAGINIEGEKEVGGDLAIDLEITSNRPDCLGHLGIAREVAVLFDKELKIPAARPAEGKTPAAELTQVRIDCPDLCFRYIARVVRSVKVAPSPKWMTRRLETVGLTPINNVVDISNYVLLECSQPLHTFDYAGLEGHEIVVRRPKPGEKIEAIDHNTYELSPEMCVIADARRPVAIAGVMGGAATEIGPSTRDVLVESAEFDPVAIRSAARKLNLHSDSSYRFERRVDPEGVEWASRRCCELILELAGGELAAGSVDVGQQPPKREPITLRFSQLQRILGIEVPADEVRRILLALGNIEANEAADPHPSSLIPHPSSLTVIPPSWRRDLTREIDLVEEVGRIHGYEEIPEDVAVPMAPSAKRREDRVLEVIRGVLTAAGLDEALTLSTVDQQLSAAVSPWTTAEPLRSLTPVIRGADRLRRSLIPSLLAARRTNEALSNPEIELFETAKVYLPRPGKLPDEQWMLGITSGQDFLTVKGWIEAVADALKCPEPPTADDSDLSLFDPQQSCRLRLGGQVLGYVGRVLPEGLKEFDLRGSTTVAEIKLGVLVAAANLMPQYAPLPPFPSVTRDVNLVVAEPVRWSDLAATVRAHAGPFFEGLQYRDTFRDPKRLGAGKKSLLFTIDLRSKEGTLTSPQADAVRDQIVAACREKHGAELRAM
ncbi:MAG: phenylalanine--tRNA ligase subunit beta [Pirellulales bacterium]|nr:phenylalanine--tRNA ligase subunit beta [Pirellulales bacterium]